jgi:hypothetical protein
MDVSVSEHEKNLRQLRCCVTRNPYVTLHHCHGGSMKFADWHVGMGQKQNPFLQIPLKAEYHVGDMGIDSGYGVERWEKDFGTQMEHLAWVNDQLGYNIFAEAVRWETTHRSKSQPSTGTRRSNGEG